jgi:hypothetical protein
MKATELRIGNWVNGEFINGEFLLSQIFRIDGNDDCSGLEPIPLTPEIMEKCGFEFNSDYGKWAKRNPYFRVDGYLKRDGGVRVPLYNGQLSQLIQYLHQLQNLYYALTGEELQINL